MRSDRILTNKNFVSNYALVVSGTLRGQWIEYEGWKHSNVPEKPLRVCDDTNGLFNLALRANDKEVFLLPDNVKELWLYPTSRTFRRTETENTSYGYTQKSLNIITIGCYWENNASDKMHVMEAVDVVTAMLKTVYDNLDYAYHVLSKLTQQHQLSDFPDIVRYMKTRAWKPFYPKDESRCLLYRDLT